MPELPEVEIVRLGLEQSLRGKRIVRVRLSGHDLRFPAPPDFAGTVQGKVLRSFVRRGKYIVGFLDDSHVLILHLGMSGRVRLYGPGQNHESEKHDHAVFEAEDGSVAVYHDPRRFGFLSYAGAKDWESLSFFSTMGPEPLSDLRVDYLGGVLKNKKVNIKTALLDQRVVAGLGNIYVCEALYDACISPMREPSSLSAKEIERLIVSIQKTLRKALEAGGSSLRDYKKTDGSLGYFQTQFSVYDREGERCPNCSCADGCVKRIVQAGRSTFYCPVIQV